MQLREEWLEHWLEVVFPDPEVRAQRRPRMAERIGDPDWRARQLVAVEEGRVRAATWLDPVGPGELILGWIRTRDQAPIGPRDAALVHEAVEAAWALGARRVESRVPEDRVTAALVRACEDTGGRRIGGRVEFQTPLAELPGRPAGVGGSDPDDGVLVWRTAEVPEAADLLARCAVDSPDALAPDEDPEGALRGYLADGEVQTRFEIGSADGTDVGLVIARVAEETGWGTLAYLGLVPAARGRRLGHEAHRRGIGTLRALGGRLYHGGTSLENGPMRACFARQGCREWRRFDVWRWRAISSQPSAISQVCG